MTEDRSPTGRLAHDRRIVLTALGAALPSLLVAAAYILTADISTRARWSLALLVVGSLAIGLMLLHERLVRPWQTLANMLAALREGDYSLRARGSGRDPMGLAYLEANLLAMSLRSQRLGAVEAEALLRTVMEEIDVAVFAFDENDRLALVNRAGATLLAEKVEDLLGRSAAQLGLEGALHDDHPRVRDHVFPGGEGRWETRLHPFRQDGRPHTLLVVADVSRALREEELLAWQRLVRVLSHEINNSLTPIKSIAGSLQRLVSSHPHAPDADDDLLAGLTIISGRADSLSRFMRSYAQLAKLPPPDLEDVSVAEWVRRTVALETRMQVEVVEGDPVTLHADGDQLDQLLINLVRNAVDACLETGGRVQVRWQNGADSVSVQVLDEGPGISSTTNLFVPFFTTKKGGSGIGLVLSRQIAENHGGTVELRNRHDTRGCVADLRLPMRSSRGRRAFPLPDDSRSR